MKIKASLLDFQQHSRESRRQIPRARHDAWCRCVELDAGIGQLPAADFDEPVAPLAISDPAVWQLLLSTRQSVS